MAKSFGTKLLFHGLSFGIEPGERIGLIGPNGAGKTTLLKILAGQASSDEGTLSYQRGLRMGFLEQVPHFPDALTVQETILAGLVGLEGSLDARELVKQPDLLVLDEPTNDLDMATLNVLQDSLTEFEGAILLVTHDRYFLDQVANKILAFPPSHAQNSGALVSFADLSQWESWFDEQ